MPVESFEFSAESYWNKGLGLKNLQKSKPYCPSLCSSNLKRLLASALFKLPSSGRSNSCQFTTVPPTSCHAVSEYVCQKIYVPLVYPQSGHHKGNHLPQCDALWQYQASSQGHKHCLFLSLLSQNSLNHLNAAFLCFLLFLQSDVLIPSWVGDWFKMKNRNSCIQKE